MKLSKQQIKDHNKAVEILQKDKLTYDDKEFVFRNYYPAFNNNIGTIASYFTPLELAQEFTIEVGDSNNVVDLCAGIGALSYALVRRSEYSDKKINLTCIERNPEFVEVGKKLVPEATWICGDILDEELINSLGRFHTCISNPPFGKIKGGDDSWLKYKGSEFEYKALEISHKIADNSVFIIPQGSCNFRLSGEQMFSAVNDNNKYNKFQKETGLIMTNGCGIDLSYYKNSWVGTNILCEIALLDTDEY